jgi:CheY-like chemotaxis protein
MVFEIVYIDDEYELATLFKEFMDSEHITVHTFEQEVDALAFFQHNHPDLILIDYRLKSMTGTDLAALLPENIPKLLVTGELELPDTSFFQQVITKPFNFALIKQFVAEAVSAKRAGY